MRKLGIWLPVMILFGCAFEKPIQSGAQQNQRIFIGEAVTPELVTRVNGDWPRIREAISKYSNDSCIDDELSAEAIDSIDLIVGHSRARFVTSNSQAELISIGFDLDCRRDSSSSSPTWIILHENDRYRVVGELLLSE